MKKATATSQGNIRFTESVIGGEGNGAEHGTAPPALRRRGGAARFVYLSMKDQAA
jgi:hypothetical protein